MTTSRVQLSRRNQAFEKRNLYGAFDPEKNGHDKSTGGHRIMATSFLVGAIAFMGMTFISGIALGKLQTVDAVASQSSNLATNVGWKSQLQDWDPDMSLEDWYTQEANRKFMNQVLGVVALQLLGTFGIAQFINSYREEIFKSEGAIGIFLGSIVTFIISAFVVAFAESVPVLAIFMGIMTFSCAVMVGFACSTHDPQIVKEALTYTIMLVSILTAYAFVGFDLTGLRPYLSIILLYIIFAGIINAFFFRRTESLAMSSFVLLIFSVCLIADLQMTIQGRYREEGPRGVALAAMQIYLDVINIFLKILEILAKSQRNH